MAGNKDRTLILVIIGAALFFFVIFIVIVVGISQSLSGTSISGLGSSVALVDIKGVIQESDDVVRQLKKYQDDRSIKALVLRVDSPGGGVAASQEIYDQLQKFSAKGKPIVVSMGSVAASGGYYVSCVADTIVADPGTITGSIGVIMEFPVIQGLMDKVGLKLEIVKSGELKDVGNPSHPLTPEERKMLQSVIDDTYRQFVDAVASNRNLDTGYVRQLADGSIFTGSQAKDKGLVDKLGTLEDAIATAGEMVDLGSKPRVVKERRYRRDVWDVLGGILGIDLSKADLVHPWPTVEYRYCQ